MRGEKKEVILPNSNKTFDSKTEKKKRAVINDYQLFNFMSGLLDSNQRPRAPQTCALPTAPNPDHFLKVLQR